MCRAGINLLSAPQRRLMQASDISLGFLCKFKLENRPYLHNLIFVWQGAAIFRAKGRFCSLTGHG